MKTTFLKKFKCLFLWFFFVYSWNCFTLNAITPDDLSDQSILQAAGSKGIIHSNNEKKDYRRRPIYRKSDNAGIIHQIDFQKFTRVVEFVPLFKHFQPSSQDPNTQFLRAPPVFFF